jgi:SAM-dependent methyltransferase
VDAHYAKDYAELEREHWWWRARRGFVKAALDRYAPLPVAGTSRRLLEVGTGAGANLEAVADAFECQGVEPDAWLREEAASRSGRPVIDGSLPGPLSFDEAQFDVCLLLDVIEHVEDDLAAMREIRRVVRPEGVAIVNVPAMPSLWSVHDEVNQHFRRYTSRRLRSVLSEAGWKVQAWRYWGTALVPLVWAERRLRRRGESRDAYRVSVPRPLVGRTLEAVTRVDYAMNPARWIAGTSLLAVCSPGPTRR